MKSKPGVCDVCGCAVVRMNPEKHKGTNKIDGHFYINGELIYVKCSIHGGNSTHDMNGGINYDENWNCSKVCINKD